MVVYRPSLVEKRKSTALFASRKLVRRRPVERQRLTKAKRDELKARNQETRKLIQSILEQEQAKVWDRATELHEQYGLHTRQWWHDAIVQAATKPKRVHPVTPWRAFVSKRLREINDEKHQNNEPCLRPADVSPQLAEVWNAMTDDQKKAETTEVIKELEDARSAATETVHNVAIRSFHDVRATVRKWKAEADALAGRAPIEILFAVVRNDYTQYNKPAIFASSQRVEDFMLAVFKNGLMDFGLRLEAYMLSGIGGVTRNYTSSLSELKSEVAKLIHAKLNEAAGRLVPSMKYINFDRLITLPYRLVIKNWPIKKFANPSDIGGKTDLEILRNAWTTGATHFETLSDDEYNKFCEALGRARDDPDEEDDLTDTEAGHHAVSSTTTSLSVASQGPTVAIPSPLAPAAPSPVDVANNNLTANDASTADTPASHPSTVSTTTTTSSASLNPLTPSPVTPPIPSAPIADAQPSAKRRRVQDPFILQCVVGPDGQAVGVAKTGRKPRKDKGVKRGPRKGKENTVTPSSTLTPSSSASPTAPPVSLSLL